MAVVFEPPAIVVSPPSTLSVHGPARSHARSLSAPPPTTSHRMAMEQWALVRPPPAQTNHPLNVQVQLLLPYGVGGRSARTSTESTRSTHAESAISFDAVANGSISAPNISSQQASPRQQFALRRSSSVRSSASSVRSHRSSFSASTSSTAGGGGTSSGGQASKGRQTAPLYNFAFHAVLQNPQVTDAGPCASPTSTHARGAR